jgi:hypothetical protein
MFNVRNFISYNGQIRGDELINEWKYVTSEDPDELIVADYFAAVGRLLSVGDIIHVYRVSDEVTSGGAMWYRRSYDMCVRARTDGHVSALPVSELTGQGELENGTSGSASTIEIGTGYSVGVAYCILSGAVLIGSNTVTVKNGSTVLFTGVLEEGSGAGSVIMMAKNGSAGAGKFDAAVFSIECDGVASAAVGSITVVLNATVTPPPAE